MLLALKTAKAAKKNPMSKYCIDQEKTGVGEKHDRSQLLSNKHLKVNFINSINQDGKMYASIRISREIAIDR